MSLETAQIVSSLNRTRYFGATEGVLGAKYSSTFAAQYSVLPFLASEKTSSPGISNKGSQGGGDHCSVDYMRNDHRMIEMDGLANRITFARVPSKPPPHVLASPPCFHACARSRPCMMTGWKADHHSARHQLRAQDSRQTAKRHPRQFSDAWKGKLVESLVLDT